MGRIAFGLRALIFIILLSVAASHAQAAIKPPTDEAQRIYLEYGDAIYQVQVIDIVSGKKNAIGSGFQINKDGYMVTNYHVVAQAIEKPTGNRLEYLNEKGSTGVLKVLIADVVNDLALLQMDKPGSTYVALGTSAMPKGARLFSLGNPRDISFAIVEGIHNGPSNESFVDKIHFSGAINSGMSGGPALSHDGKVAGVNVMTGGNGVGFLVPVERVKRMAESFPKLDPAYDFVKNANSLIEQQLLDSQDRNMQALFAKPWESVPFGLITAPGRIHAAFKCWGAAAHQDKDPYRYFYSSCASQDRIFLSDNFDTGAYTIRYDQITGEKKLPLPRFYAFYEQIYGSYQEGYWSSDGMNTAGESDVSNFECNSDFVDIDGLRWKSSFCLRRYIRFPNLYDAGVFMALTGEGRKGMLVTMIAQGVSKPNAQQMARHFMDSIKRAPPGAVDSTAALAKPIVEKKPSVEQKK